MTPRLTVWRSVQDGGYVRDLNGAAWRVRFLREARMIELTGRNGEVKTIKPPSPEREVTVLEPSHLEALSAVGGKVLAERDGNQPWRVPAITEIGSARSHLFMLHGEHAADIKRLDAARQRHRESHADYDEGRRHLLHGYQDHRHTR